MAETLNHAAQRVLECVSDALDDVMRPVCKVYQSLGTPVIYTCCECDDEGANGELSIHFTRLFDADASTLEEVVRTRPCRGGVIAAQFRLVLARCAPTIDERGEIPDPQVVADAAVEQMWDSELIWNTLACCTDLRLRIDDISPDLGPMGGCSIVYADITVEVEVPKSPLVTYIEPGIYTVRNAVVTEPEPGEYEVN